MLFRRLRAAKILSQWFEAERSRSAQGPGKRPAPSREFQARQAGMQVRTPARPLGPRVGLDGVPSRYEAKQAGLDRTLLAAYTGTQRRHTRDMPFGSRGHDKRQVYRVRRSGRPGGTRAAQASEDGTTAASDLMSMRQPVSLAASLAFCPSLPMASDSW
jgi:hypothetical protein